MIDREFLLYNTMSHRKERMHPRSGQGNKLSMYCCGVTVYDLSHIGDTLDLPYLYSIQVPTRAMLVQQLPISGA